MAHYFVATEYRLAEDATEIRHFDFYFQSYSSDPPQTHSHFLEAVHDQAFHAVLEFLRRKAGREKSTPPDFHLLGVFVSTRTSPVVPSR